MLTLFRKNDSHERVFGCTGNIYCLWYSQLWALLEIKDRAKFWTASDISIHFLTFNER